MRQRATIVMPVVVWLLAGCLNNSLGQNKGPSSAVGTKRLADGKLWTTQNLSVESAGSYCYENAAENCRQYGRLYTWAAAKQVCKFLGKGWRLPSNDEWSQMAEPYGGIWDLSADTGRVAYKSLLVGGTSGFDAVLGGGRAMNGEYARLEAHGFYWTASENDAATAWFYNFGIGMRALGRHRDGEKQRAFAVRCVRN